MDERNNQIEVMISHFVRGKLPPDATQEEWAEFNSSFVRCEMTARELAVNIYRGYSFAPVYKDRRKKDNFVGAWHIALDFDTGDEHASLETLANDQFSNCFASFGYGTPSSTPAQPRSRLVFVFPYDDPIVDMVEYEELYKALLWRYPHADKATKDALRLFYGSLEGEVWANWSIFPAPARQVCIEQYREHLTTTATPQPIAVVRNSNRKFGQYVEKALTNAAEGINAAQEGDRHWKLWAAGLLLGELYAADWAGITDVNAEIAKLIRAATWVNSQGDLQEVERVLGDAIERGKMNPRPEPERRIPGPWELLPRHR